MWSGTEEWARERQFQSPLLVFLGSWRLLRSPVSMKLPFPHSRAYFTTYLVLASWQVLLGHLGTKKNKPVFWVLQKARFLHAPVPCLLVRNGYNKTRQVAQRGGARCVRAAACGGTPHLCASCAGLGSLGRDAGSASAAALASLQNWGVTHSQEALLEAREEFRGRLKLQPFCLDLSVCVLVFGKVLWQACLCWCNTFVRPEKTCTTLSTGILRTCLICSWYKLCRAWAFFLLCVKHSI